MSRKAVNKARMKQKYRKRVRKLERQYDAGGSRMMGNVARMDSGAGPSRRSFSHDVDLFPVIGK